MRVILQFEWWLMVRNWKVLISRSFFCWFIRWFIHSFIRTFIRSFIHSFVHSLLYSFVYSFIYSFIWSELKFLNSLSSGGISTFVDAFDCLPIELLNDSSPSSVVNTSAEVSTAVLSAAAFANRLAHVASQLNKIVWIKMLFI